MQDQVLTEYINAEDCNDPLMKVLTAKLSDKVKINPQKILELKEKREEERQLQQEKNVAH